MNRSHEESQGGPNIFTEEGTFPPLNLHLTKSPEFINLIDSTFKQEYPCSRQQKSHDFTKNLTPPETPKTHEKPKAMNFPISKITIGEWNCVANYPDDLKAKFYFAKKKLMWENLDYVDTGTKIARLKRKIEIQWADVSSLRVTINSHDETEILEIELRKRPTFFMETNPQAGKHTQWKQMDQDFTQNHSASRFRRHTLHFAPGVLQKNMEKLVANDSFWSERFKVNFPSLQNIYFDIGYENNNNSNNSSSNLPHHSHGQTLSFNVNNEHLHHHSQGFGHVPMGEGNLNVATQFYANDGRQTNPFVQDNHANQLLGMQAIQPSSQLINEHYNRGRYFTGSHFHNPMMQDQSHMKNTGDLRGSQAYAQTLLETQTNSMIFQHMNEQSMYPPQVGPYLQGYLAQERETLNMENTHLDGNFQTNNICLNQFPNYGYDQYFSNNNGSVAPGL